jgi:quercetin dioxygenase-like cupin family protein
MKKYLLALPVLLLPLSSFAQQSTGKVSTIIEDSISGVPDKKLVWLKVQFPPGAGTIVHTHPGDEYGVVLEGEWSVRPDEGDWNVFVTGQSWHNPAGMVHQGMNRTSGTVTAMFTFVVDKNKPLVIPYLKQ